MTSVQLPEPGSLDEPAPGAERPAATRRRRGASGGAETARPEQAVLQASAVPIWFRHQPGALAGWLHLPPGGAARGGVVLCPSLGLESLTAHSAYRRIAEALAAVGLAVLRFDYRGTGDSSGTLEEASVEGWIDDIAAARAHLQACGVAGVALVGLRLGATLAAASAARWRPEALVLWDPCSRGRAFVREQQALKAFSIGDSPAPDGEGVELASLLLPARLAAQLGRLSLADVAIRATPCLLLQRSSRPDDALVDACLSDAVVDRALVAGQEAFIDIEPGSSVVPEATLGSITSWMAERFAGEADVPVEVLGTSEVALAGHGREEVVERAVVFGEHGAFGIVSEPKAGAQGPAIVLSSLGALPHVGPGRLWVELARSWAGEGRRVLRFDLGGIGDSPAHPGRTARVAYPTDGVADLLEAAALASPADPRNVVLVGICSGAYHSVEAASRLRPAGVAIVNPVFSLVPEELRDPAACASEGPPLPRANPAISWMRHNELVVRIAKLPWLDAIRYDPEIAKKLDERLPERFWHLLMRAGLASAPGPGLVTLSEHGTDALVVCGRQEARPYRRCRRMVAELERTGKFRLVTLDWIDHSLFGAASGETVRRILVDHVGTAFPVGRRPRHLGGVQRPAEPVALAAAAENGGVSLRVPRAGASWAQRSRRGRRGRGG